MGKIAPNVINYAKYPFTENQIIWRKRKISLTLLAIFFNGGESHNPSNQLGKFFILYSSLKYGSLSVFPYMLPGTAAAVAVLTAIC